MKVHLYSLKANFGILYNTFEFLVNKDVDALFLVSKYSKNKDKKVISFSKSLWFLHRIFFRILKKTNTPYYIIRHLQEYFYDLYYSHKLKEGVIILTTNGWIPKLISKNKKLGGVCYIYAGNPCDLEISKAIDKIREGIFNVKDIYSYQPRLNRYKKTIESCDKVIVFNPYIKHSFLNYVDESKIHKLYDFIFNDSKTLPEISINKNIALTFCYIGHTILLKGLQVLLEAWEEIENKNVHLLIGGSIQEELKPILLPKISKFKNITYLGRVDDLNKFLRSSHVLICPSIIDAGPRTIVEAMYCNLPVISSENCGNSYLIDHESTGLIYKNNDSNELAKCISWFIENKTQIPKMGLSAHLKIENTLKMESNVYSNIYELIKDIK